MICVNSELRRPRWCLATERVPGSGERVPTELCNDYGEFVAVPCKGLIAEFSKARGSRFDLALGDSSLSDALLVDAPDAVQVVLGQSRRWTLRR